MDLKWWKVLYDRVGGGAFQGSHSDEDDENNNSQQRFFLTRAFEVSSL